VLSVPILNEFSGKIKILSSHNVLCREFTEFTVVYWKITTFSLILFSTFTMSLMWQCHFDPFFNDDNIHTFQPLALKRQTFWMLWVVGQLMSRETHETRLFFGSISLFHYNILTLFSSVRHLLKPTMHQTSSRFNILFLTFFVFNLWESLQPRVKNNNNNFVLPVLS